MAFEWRKAQFAVFLFEHCASLFHFHTGHLLYPKLFVPI